MRYIINYLTVSLAVLMTACGQKDTQDSGLVLHYDFEQSEMGVVKDLGPNHIDATLMGNALVADGSLVLTGENDYLDMTAAAGEMVKQLADLTIATNYYVAPETEIKGYGYFLWCFSCLEANAEKDGPYQAYRINEQRCETSIGGWSQETGIQKSQKSELGKWVSVVFRQQGSKGELYIGGELIGTDETFPVLCETFAEAPAFNWMGRAPFNGDKFLENTRISDFRIYNKSLSDAELQELLKEYSQE